MFKICKIYLTNVRITLMYLYYDKSVSLAQMIKTGKEVKTLELKMLPSNQFHRGQRATWL